MAKRKYPKSAAIEDAKVSSGDTPMYVSWDGTAPQRTKAFSEMSKASAEYGAVAHRQDFSDLASNVSGRPGLTRREYEYFRPNEEVPTGHKEIIKKVDSAYKRISLVRNIIDLMGDFACQGIRLTHPNKRIEKFYRNWFSRVNGKDRTERFLNNFYRTGAVIVRIRNAKVNTKLKDDIFKSIATPEISIEPLKQPKNEIPFNYTFVSPTIVDVIGGSLAAFTGKTQYGISLPDSLRKKIKSPKGAAERALVDSLPSEIIRAAQSRDIIPLPDETTEVFHYKKDDWEEWASPILYATLVDLMMLEKLKLSDVAALDGAVSNIRIFKLGNIEAKIAPTSAAVSRLAEVLESHTGAGTMDLVWGPDIEMIESKTNVHQFLGKAKYEPTLESIYGGLGVPQTLTGSSASGGTTNNFISLKTLVKRLQYGRDTVKAFWAKEIIKVQKAMGFRFPAQIEFDNMNLGDEEAEKALWIQLADRNLISDELLQYRFGNDPEMERIRLNRENRDRRDAKQVPKAGPWYDPQPKESLKRISLQTGVATPGQVGLKLEDKPEGEQLPSEVKQGKEPGKKKNPGEPQQGRPKNSKDSEKRKPKKFTPRLKALELWACEAQENIGKLIAPMILKYFAKKNMRSLSEVEHKEAELIKFGVLCHTKPFSEVTAKSVHDCLKKGDIPGKISVQYNEALADTTDMFTRKLTLDELRNIQAYVYAMSLGE